MKKEISVIIVTYNSEKHIYECLNSLFLNNDIGDALEVIVVDNQSEAYDEMKRRLFEAYGDKVVVIHNDRNGGYGQGNNLGIKASKAPVIMIMNPDVRLVEPIFKRALNAFSNPFVVQFGIRQLDKNLNSAYSFAVSSIIHPLLGLPLTSVCNKIQWFIPKIMYVVGACFFIRKSSFVEIGLFDERLFMYMEEDDIHYRLMKNKRAKIVYDPSIGYAHLHGLYSTYKVDDYTYELTSLKNSILINGERGFSKKSVIKRQIVWSRLFVIKEMLAYTLHHTSKTKDNIEHLRGWIKMLKNGS